MREKSRRRSRRGWMVLGAALLLGVLLYAMAADGVLSGLWARLSTPAREDLGWELTLVNADHPIPADYQAELTTLSNGEQVDSRIYPDLQNMFDDARAQGLGLFVRAGYRTETEQQRLLEEKTAAYEDEGYSPSEAEALARDWVALPGTSEHQLGLAVDINADTEISDDQTVYDWLRENAWRYGFVLRYPPDKTNLTGIANEPWHFRYVGKTAAAEMYEKNLCLEEYIKALP